MTIEEAKLNVKEALKAGSALDVKEALKCYWRIRTSIREEEDATVTALYTTAVEIFTPKMGQMNL